MPRLASSRAGAYLGTSAARSPDAAQRSILSMASAVEQLASNLNFSVFAKAEDLKKRIWFTLGALLVYRLGTYIPMPGINPDAFAHAFQQQSGGVLGMFNMFSGGAVQRMAIFALG